MLVGPITPLPPLLAGVIEEFAHGDWARDGPEQSDQQPLDAEGQAGGDIEC